MDEIETKERREAPKPESILSWQESVCLGASSQEEGFCLKGPAHQCVLGSQSIAFSSVLLDKKLFCKDFYLLYTSYTGDVI